MAANDYFDTGDYTALTKATLARAEAVNAIFTAVEGGFSRLPSESELKEMRATYAVDTGAADAYAVALPYTLSSYTAGLTVVVEIANDNTGASTLDVDGVGAVAIKRYDGDDLAAGDLKDGQIAVLTYDGTVFRLTGPHGSDVDAAASSATAAASSASSASSSASAAASSASSASTSASSASTSASNASTSASAAASSATDAATEKGYAQQWATRAEDSLITAAAGGDESTDYSALHHAAKAAASASAASSSASAASSSASSASSSASAAASSASAAAASETAASASETAAAASETAAAGSATAAAASETAAATSETNAAASESAAADSEAAAATSEQNAAAIANYPAHLIGAVELALDLIGQSERAVEDLVADVPQILSTLQLVLDIAAQVSGQVNGGTVTLRGGSLSVPALQIGDAKIYQAASDTLSVAVADTEVVRVTTSGITVYGTVTESP